MRPSLSTGFEDMANGLRADKAIFSNQDGPKRQRREIADQDDHNNPSKIVLPTYTNHDGYRMPEGFPVQGFESCLQYAAQPNDVFVATYPKCGTTWMQYIVYLILHQGRPLPASEKLDQKFPHLEEVGAECCQNLTLTSCPTPGSTGYRLIKTHLYHSMTPKHPKAKYIYIARNPKDVVVSFFHHTRGFERLYHFADGSFDVYFDLFARGEVDFGDYFVHLRSWLDHRLDENVLFLTYEKMRANPRETILKVAEFLDPKGLHYLSEISANNAAILEQVLVHSSLKEMKAHPQRWSSPRAERHAPFVRKGSVGGWEELLKPPQVQLLDEKMKVTCSAEELKLLGRMYWSSTEDHTDGPLQWL